MRRVILESPYAAKGWWLRAMFGRWRNRVYARRCARDSLKRGEAPIASHLLYTQRGILKDHIPDERALGIGAGLAWGPVAEATVVYIDRGVSKGMWIGIENAKRAGRRVEYRAMWASSIVDFERTYPRIRVDIHEPWRRLCDELHARHADRPSRPLTEGMINKGGHNTWPSQVIDRPPPPAPSRSPDDALLRHEFLRSVMNDPRKR